MSEEASAINNEAQETEATGDASVNHDNNYVPLTDTYERLRHSQDSQELHDFARKPLPDRSLQSEFSRATALLEAVAGNRYTPQEDRVFLAQTMPFPNVLVKLSQDESEEVRRAVAANTDAKNWLVGRLTKDESPEVRNIALHNPQTSWKMRLEGAQNPQVDAQTLDFLASLGVELEADAPAVLSSMVRRAVALNPNTREETVRKLADDVSVEVQHAAQRRLAQQEQAE